MVHQETFFEDLVARNEPSAAFFGNSRRLAAAQCEPVSLNTGRLATLSSVRNGPLWEVWDPIRKIGSRKWAPPCGQKKKHESSEIRKSSQIHLVDRPTIHGV